MPDEPVPIQETTLEQDIQAALEGAVEPVGESAAAPITPEEPAAPESAPAESPVEPEISDDKLLLSAISAFGAEELAKKYATDADLIQGLKNLNQKISQRDGDAEYGRWVRDQYGDLSRVPFPQQQQPPQPPVQQEPPPTYDQYKLWQSQVQKNPETGVLEPVPGASPDVVRKYQAAADQIERTILELSFDRDRALRPVVESVTQQAQQVAAQTAQQALAQQGVLGEINQWEEQNKGWLFNGGNRQAGFSPHAEQLQQVCQEYGLVQAIHEGRYTPKQALDMGVWILRGKTMPTAPVAAPKPQAEHKPNISNQLPVKTSYEDLTTIREDESLEQHLMRLHAATGRFL